MTPSALRALLIDDEPRAREILHYYLGKVGGIEVVGEAGDGAEALRLVRTLDPDVVFLDIHMPDLNGLEAARLLHRGGGPRPLLVFVTAYEEHALAAFETEAVDYLVKPLTVARVAETVDRLRRRPSTPAVTPAPAPRARRLPLAVADPERAQRTVFLDPAGIVLVEAQGKACTLWTRQTKLTVLHSLADLEQSLAAGAFFRLHRSYLVNLRAVTELYADSRSHWVKLEGCPLAVPVSREKVAALRSALGLER
jgi:DNA-binding LytR/AlgR family response regulator